jgi:hypothetical protein
MHNNNNNNKEENFLEIQSKRYQRNSTTNRKLKAENTGEGPTNQTI